MGNSQQKYLKDPEIQKLKPQFATIELEMLGLLFKDLSDRHHGIIDKETFLQFFPLTGLWGERLFEKFDLKRTEHLDFYEFVQGIATCCTLNEEEKIRFLFSLYDMDQDGYIKKKEMITMLYNYPKNHIKFITEEIAADRGEKLEQVSEARRLQVTQEHDDNLLGLHNIVSPNKSKVGTAQSIHSDNVDGVLNDELVVAEEEKKATKFLPVERDISKSYSFHVQRESQVQMKIEMESHKNGQQKAQPLPKLDMRGVESNKTKLEMASPELGERKNSIDRYIPTKNPGKELGLPGSDLGLAIGRKSSTSTVILDQSFVNATTVNTRVKEYASFMFRTFEGANTRGKINFEEFKQWITMHPIILKVFDETFHQEIWATRHLPHPTQANGFDSIGGSPQKGQVEPERTSLKYREKPAEMSGIMYKKGKKMGGWKKRYVELREHFLFFYSKKEDKMPRGIVFLEGCYVEELNDYKSTHKYGFTITHKSESYEGYTLYCNDKAEFDKWMTYLKLFKSSTIMDMYTFHEKIGTGKFSIVYRATSKADKSKEYAIKVIEKKLLKPEEKEFLLSETSVMKILDHPNMIKLIDTIETKSHIYIVTEIVKDGDLFDYIVGREFLDEYDASFIMKQLLISIYYLHNIGIIHRDLKPENLLITLGSNGEVKELKIIDFGFAKLVNEGIKIYETCGTPNYVAPEVLRGNGYDKRADIWSLGVIMYLMIRGYLPFDAADVNMILRNTLKGEVPFEDDHFRNISPEAKDLLSKFLQKDPNNRIDIKDALRHPWIKNRDDLKQYVGINKRNNESDSATGYVGGI